MRISRSGRVIKPRLAFWLGERIVYDCYGTPIKTENVITDTESFGSAVSLWFNAQTVAFYGSVMITSNRVFSSNICKSSGTSHTVFVTIFQNTTKCSLSLSNGMKQKKRRKSANDSFKARKSIVRLVDYSDISSSGEDNGGECDSDISASLHVRRAKVSLLHNFNYFYCFKFPIFNFFYCSGNLSCFVCFGQLLGSFLFRVFAEKSLHHQKKVFFQSNQVAIRRRVVVIV